MKKLPDKKQVLMECAALLVFVLCVVLVFAVHSSPSTVRYARAVEPFFFLQPESVEEEVIPGYAGIRRTYIFPLPESNTATTTGACITAYLRHTYAEISVDDITLLSGPDEADAPDGSTPGNYWISVPMRPAYAGKTARITLTPIYDSVRDETPTFMVITHDSLLTMIELPKDGFLLALSLLAILSGLFLTVTALILPLYRPTRYRLIYLGVEAMLVGVWKLCGLPAVTLLLDYRGIHTEIWYTGAVCYILMLVMSLRLLVLMRSQDENRTGRLCFYLAAALAAVALLLQITGVMALHRVLIWFGACMALLHLVSLFGQKPDRSELLWLLPFFLTLGIDLLIYSVTGSMRGAPAFLIWFILYLFVRGFGFVREAITRERELRRKEEELRNTKLQSMMNQIRPHFIYTTLTSIYVLCRDDPEMAMQVIQDFTAYLQANFTAISAVEPITFSDELRHTQAYISVEALRYGDKLQVDYDIRHTAFRLPPLTLQPLVENAVKHCLGKGIAPEHIRVSTWMEDGSSVITVTDDGPGIGAEDADAEVHVGLRNVRERLELMCGGSLRVESAGGQGTTVTVTIPHD